MRKSQTKPIQEVVQEYLRELKIDRKLKEVHLISQWESVMGKTVAVRTRELTIRNRVLYVEVTSAVLKNELLMMREAIIEKLNENAGEKLIEKMVIK
jgi:predicted nucleic acid-binding Zn ribbon protein